MDSCRESVLEGKQGQGPCDVSGMGVLEGQEMATWSAAGEQA